MDREPLEKRYVQAYDDFADALFRFCVLRVSDKTLAEDLTQETFMKTWKYLADGNEIENLKAFLFKTATNLIIDYYRKKKESSLNALLEEGFDIEGDGSDSTIDFAAGREAIALIDKLEPGYREIMVMRYVEDMPVYEIAGLIGESENVVSVRIHRAIKKLRNLLNV